MFESLDGKTLAALANLEDRSRLHKEAKIEALLGTLEQAAKECQTRALSGSAPEYEQIASGIFASQRIVAKWWGAE